MYYITLHKKNQPLKTLNKKVSDKVENFFTRLILLRRGAPENRFGTR